MKECNVTRVVTSNSGFSLKRKVWLAAFFLTGMLAGTTQAQVSGRVFQDYNGNAIYETNATIPAEDGSALPIAEDKGLSGVTVSAYDASNVLVGSAVTGATGQYTIAAVSGSLRIEFTTFPTNFLSGPMGADNGSSVQFVTAPATGIDLGINKPWEYSENNPQLAMSCYVPLSNDGMFANSDVLVSIPNTAGSAVYSNGNDCGSCPTAYNLPAPTHLAMHSQIGATFGLGWQRSTKTLFAATYIKQFSDIGPQGTGAIYRIDMSDPSNPAVLNGAPNTPAGPIDLNLIFGAGTMGANPFSPYPDYNLESERERVGDAVYNAAFADIDVSSDGKTLFALSFKDKKIYAIPIDGSPINSTTVKAATIPVITGLVLNDVRPTGLGIKDGKVYVLTQGLTFGMNTSYGYDTDRKSVV